MEFYWLVYRSDHTNKEVETKNRKTIYSPISFYFEKNWAFTENDNFSYMFVNSLFSHTFYYYLNIFFVVVVSSK